MAATTTKVAIAVLIFGSGLSKRDRAELHGQAEKAGGVASSSLGVGTARFLTLTCGLGGMGAAVELKLSAEKVRRDSCFTRSPGLCRTHVRCGAGGPWECVIHRFAFVSYLCTRYLIFGRVLCGVFWSGWGHLFR